MIERIALTRLLDDHFCILDHNRAFNNRDFQTLEIHQARHYNRVWNVVQCRSYRQRKKLQFQYPDEFTGCASSIIEPHLSNLRFGLGDIRIGAQFFVIDAEHLTPAKIARWLKQNCSGDVIAIEGRHAVRASFDNENDFLLTKMTFK